MDKRFSKPFICKFGGFWHIVGTDGWISCAFSSWKVAVDWLENIKKPLQEVSFL